MPFLKDVIRGLGERVNHVTHSGMIRMSVRDIRLHWPEAERNIEAHGEIVVTRDGSPVARILPWTEPQPATRPRFDPQQQSEWLRRLWGDVSVSPSTDELLARERED